MANNKNLTVFGTTFTNVPKHYAAKLKQMEDMALNPVVQSFYTVEEYIEKHPDSVVERRTSRKGVALVTVKYPDGSIKQYEQERLWNTCSYQYQEV